MGQVRLAYQVLKIAERFTENRSKFALYWTDLSYEHLAVDSRGVVKVIDASRIMVVDRWQIQKGKGAFQNIWWTAFRYSKVSMVRWHFKISGGPLAVADAER